MSKVYSVLKETDWLFFFCVVFLMILSLLLLFSATQGTTEGIVFSSFFKKQIIWSGIGIMLMFIMSRVDETIWLKLSWPIYMGAVGLLVAVIGVGKKVAGARRWLSFPGVTIQPSEFSKIAIILLIANLLGNVVEKKGSIEFKDIILPGCATLLCFILIAIEPDLGTALTLIPVFVVLLFLSRLKVIYFIFLLVAVMASTPLMWMSLKDYQKSRIKTFLSPSEDQFGAGWTVRQSKIAIGSGKWKGRGFLQGSQTQLAFLPERHTDFIFAVLGEEWGFWGVMSFFLCWLLLLSRSIMIINRCVYPSSQLIIYGLLVLWNFQLIINANMIIGRLPVTGLPMPFLSYGGSSLLSTLMGCGFIMSVCKGVSRRGKSYIKLKRRGERGKNY